MRDALGTLRAAVFAACVAAAGLAYGHAVVVRSSLDGQPLRAETPTQVTLHFNSRIERGFTRVVLLGGTAKEQPLSVGDEGDAGRVTIDLPGLAAGTYALRYKVLAADGHITESTLRFHVTPAN